MFPTSPVSITVSEGPVESEGLCHQYSVAVAFELNSFVSVLLPNKRLVEANCSGVGPTAL